MKTFLNVVALILFVCILVTGIASFENRHSGTLFAYLRMHQEHAPLALTPTTPCGNTQTQTLWEWVEDSRVIFDQTLILVNLKNPLPEDYKADIKEYNGAKMHPSMVENYAAMRDAVKMATGTRIYVSSDFRTAEEQAELLEQYGPDRAAPVGCSEHEAGLSLDLYAPEHASYEFLNCAAGRMVNRICHKYGFIIRYEVNKTEVTGFDYEPWHLRYVGVPHAELVANSGLAFEEYINAITPETWYAYENYRILRTNNIEEITLPASFLSCHISPDNTGCYVVTVKL